MTMTCGTCLYFTPAADGFGGCKRYPPVVNLHQSSVFPTTRADNWCGEHAAITIDRSGMGSFTIDRASSSEQDAPVAEPEPVPVTKARNWMRWR